MPENGMLSSGVGVRSDAHLEPKEMIDRLVDQTRQGRPNIDETQKTLHVLSEMLSDRFAREERESWHEEAILRAPWLSGAMRHLKDQHVELLSKLDELRHAMDSPSGGPGFDHQLDEFIDLYCEHEAAEVNLLQDSCEQPTWMMD